MWLRLAALAAFAIAPCVTAQAWSPDAVPAASTETLALDDAFDRVARAHPDLRLFGPRTEALLAERDLAALRPPLRIGAELENAFGTGAASGVGNAELTLTLAGVFERGGKLDARRTLAQGRIDALALQRETRRLDLLAETAHRYLALVAAEAEARIAQTDIEQRRRAVAAARQRVQAGASPESVLLTAQAALAKAELAAARVAQQASSARRQLAALWGERAPTFAVATADPLALPEIDALDRLDVLLRDMPELAQFADEQRIREARLRLARADAAPDIDWQVGLRRLQDGRDTALVAGVSVPFGSASRAQPAIRAAQAELESLALERESRDVALYATLADAHGRYGVARLEVQRTQQEVLPVLVRAEQAAERAYRSGAISYLEWAQLQSERIAVRRQQLEAALDAQQALIELQRLTGQSFAAGTPARGNTP